VVLDREKEKALLSVEKKSGGLEEIVRERDVVRM